MEEKDEGEGGEGRRRIRNRSIRRRMEEVEKEEEREEQEEDKEEKKSDKEGVGAGGGGGRKKEMIHYNGSYWRHSLPESARGQIIIISFVLTFQLSFPTIFCSKLLKTVRDIIMNVNKQYLLCLVSATYSLTLTGCTPSLFTACG